MIIGNKLMITDDEDGPRYIGGDMEKVALMLLSERRQKSWYPSVHNSLIDEILNNADGNRALKYLHGRKAEGELYESFRIVEIEEAIYLKPCPDITARFYELVEYAKQNKIWDNWLEFHHEGHTEQNYKEAESEGSKIDPPQDYVIFTYEHLDIEYEECYYKSFFQEWFGNVKIEVYGNEVEVMR